MLYRGVIDIEQTWLKINQNHERLMLQTNRNIFAWRTCEAAFMLHNNPHDSNDDNNILHSNIKKDATYVIITNKW